MIYRSLVREELGLCQSTAGNGTSSCCVGFVRRAPQLVADTKGDGSSRDTNCVFDCYH
jgi:hypothetical protein